MHSVWHIPEILVHILLNLNKDDLARCYHVSHHWRDTLKTNLLPQQLPLPDTTVPQTSGTTIRENSHRTPLPQSIRDLAVKINTEEALWLNFADWPVLGDEYHFWREGVLEDLLALLRPHLHPFLSKRSYRILTIPTSLSKASMGIRLETKCTIQEILNFLDNESSEWRALALPLPRAASRSVEMYCSGMKWDESSDSVQSRHGRSCIRVERQKGVRMGDVIDELRGVLIPSTDDTVLLEWSFDESSKSEE
jgi:hypothetical protein